MTKTTMLIISILFVSSIALVAPGVAVGAAETAAGSGGAQPARGTAAPAASAGPGSGVIWVERLEVSPSEILSDGEIEAAIAPYERRYLTIADLSEAVDRLNRLYWEKGFVTAQAVLPPQTIADGVVHIELVEARVGEVWVEGNRYTQSRFIVDRMGLKPGDLLDVARLESDLLFFNAVYDVQLLARLEPGDAFGTTDYVIQAVEPKRLSGEIGYVTSTMRDSGSNRSTLTVTSRGVFGRSDPLTLTLSGGSGAQAGSVAYTLPVGRGGGKLELSYQTNHLKVESGGLDELDVTTDSSAGGVGWSQPLAAWPGLNVDFTADYRWLRSRTTVLGAQLIDQFQQGMTYGISSQVIGPDSVLHVRHAVTKGYYHTQIGSEWFAKYWGQLSRHMRWRERYALSIRFNWQLKWGGTLPASEQFALGGSGSVRGLSAGAGSGDNGYVLSFEIRRPIQEVWEAFAFVDRGAAYPDPGGLGSATGVGLGLDVKLSRSLSATVVYGVPLGLDDPGLSRGRWDLRASLAF